MQPTRLTRHAVLTPYVYPDALRAQVSLVPATPGVYFFYGSSDWPLYIGKSINLRSRLLSHLRNADEAALLQQTQRITYQETSGELGALLLEAQLIKQHKPLFNKRLRKLRQLHTICLDGAVPRVEALKVHEIGNKSGMYGLFKNRRSALTTLKSIADERRLCYGLCGIESKSIGRPCFRFGLKKCAGACCGQVSLTDHQTDLLEGLRRLEIMCWPWPGKVAIREQGRDKERYHVIYNWAWLGDAASLDEARMLKAVAEEYDLDSYKILCKPMLTEQYDIIPLT